MDGLTAVVLHWLQGQGEYKQFVQNRVKKIQAHSEISWRHVGTSENPADLASRGGRVTESTLSSHMASQPRKMAT